MNQVHKENLTHVENANPGRQGLEIEIFGMEGVPAEIIDQHNQQVTQAHFAEEQERARVTGNPVRGLYANGAAPEQKRARVNESLEEIEQRAAKYREDRKNGVLPLPAAVKEIVSNPVCSEAIRGPEEYNANNMYRHHHSSKLPTAHPHIRLNRPSHLLQMAPWLQRQAQYRISPARYRLDLGSVRLWMRYNRQLTISLREYSRRRQRRKRKTRRARRTRT
jgi:hypothetical protein